MIGFDSVKCNSLNIAKLPVINNKVAALSPACNWLAYSAEFGNYTFSDMNLTPGFSNSNWFNVDSVNSNQNFTLDVSSFKNYDFIDIYLYNFQSQANYYVRVNYPATQVTINKEFLEAYRGISTINVKAYKSSEQIMNNQSCYFTKTINFFFYRKFFYQ
ncbi:MAG: hypothetical protein IT236_13780 [Bacteroidia bacterium]|nr:hypothetical protein [Bacteroidia bacterium]